MRVGNNSSDELYFWTLESETTDYVAQRMLVELGFDLARSQLF